MVKQKSIKMGAARIFEDFKDKVKLYVDNYELSEKQEAQVYNLLIYFFQGRNPDKQMSKHNSNKGLMIIGKLGVGKTLTLKVIQKMLPNRIKFALNTADELVALYDTAGASGILDVIQKKERVIDDLGSESPGKHYGKDENVMERIIMGRYNLFQSEGLRTHFTTNLTPDQIQEKYGERSYSRLLEMTQFVYLSGEDNRHKSKPVTVANRPHIDRKPEESEEEKLKKARNSYLKACIFDPYDEYLKTNNFRLSGLRMAHDLCVEHGIIESELDQEVLDDCLKRAELKYKAQLDKPIKTRLDKINTDKVMRILEENNGKPPKNEVEPVYKEFVFKALVDKFKDESADIREKLKPLVL